MTNSQIKAIQMLLLSIQKNMSKEANSSSGEAIDDSASCEVNDDCGAEQATAKTTDET